MAPRKAANDGRQRQRLEKEIREWIGKTQRAHAKERNNRGCEFIHAGRSIDTRHPLPALSTTTPINRAANAHARFNQLDALAPLGNKDAGLHGYNEYDSPANLLSASPTGQPTDRSGVQLKLKNL